MQRLLDLVYLYAVLAALFAVVIGYILNKQRDQKTQKEMEARPRLTMAEIRSFQAKLARASLPVAKISTTLSESHAATSSRIAGAPFADKDNNTWPVDPSDRQPMLFLAQVNFAEIAPIADFPERGILQLFGRCDSAGYLMGLDDPEDRVIRWVSDPEGDEILAIPEDFKNHKATTFTTKARQKGLALVFKKDVLRGHSYNWPFEEQLHGFYQRLGDDEDAESFLHNWEVEMDNEIENAGAHWIGGQPRFVQDDIRYDAEFQKLDRVLLHLGFDDNICIGDAGELNLMISQSDLRAKCFDKALCYWDCS